VSANQPVGAVSAAALPGRLSRVLNAPTLTLLGLNAALGSAILFDVAGITASAGPAGIISFLIGALLFIPLALSQLELSRAFPEAGAPGRYPLYTHGSFTNLINAFSSLVWYVFIAPFEAFAIIEGLNSYYPLFISSAGFPTYAGSLLGVAITLLFIPLNYFGSRIVGRSNFASGAVKLLLYAALGIGLLAVLHHPGNLTGFGGFAPAGATGILQSLPLVMFTYASARVVADYAEEAKSGGTLTWAFGGLVAGQLVMYVLFEFAFLTGINWAALGVAPGHWAALAKVTSNPFILLARNAHVGLLVVIAVVMGIGLPFLTGFVYLGAGSRVVLAASRAGYVSTYLSRIDRRYQSPNYAVITFAVIGAVLAFVTAPVHSIFRIIDYALVGGYIGYSFSAVSMAAARRQGFTRNRVPLGWLVSAAAFAIGGLIVYWSGWPAVPYSMVIIAGAVIIFALAFRVRANFARSLWAIGYMAFLLLMTYIGSVGKLSLLSFGYSSLTVLIISLGLFYPLGILSALKPDQAKAIYRQHAGELANAAPAAQAGQPGSAEPGSQ
jgi:amino acid transporter